MTEPTSSSSSSSPGGSSLIELPRVLGLTDIVLMNVVAIVGLRWISRGARIGAPAITLWMLAWAMFCIPLAAAVAELSSRHPEQGGLYVWVRRAFGPVHGFICGWCLWVNNLFYFPALLLFAAANLAVALGEAGRGLGDNRAFTVLFVLVFLWATAALNIRGFGAGKWLQNFGGLLIWIPVGLLIVAGGVSLAMFGSTTSFAPAALWPHDDLLSTLSLWSAMCFAFSGFEIGSMSGQEVRNPRRTIPRALLISGFLVTIVYIASTAAVLVAVPVSTLAERSGIADAVDIVSSRMGLAGLGIVTAAVIAIQSIAGTSTWAAGSARVGFAAGLDRMLPPAMARLHPRYKTPHVALIVQAIVSSLILFASVFLTFTGANSTIQEAYDILVNLTIVIYFIPYLYLFPALIRLRRTALAANGGVEPAETVPVPGGSFGLWAVAICGSLATIVSLALVFVPPAGTTHVLNYEANLVLQFLVVMGAGGVLYLISRRRR